MYSLRHLRSWRLQSLGWRRSTGEVAGDWFWQGRWFVGWRRGQETSFCSGFSCGTKVNHASADTGSSTAKRASVKEVSQATKKSKASVDIKNVECIEIKGCGVAEVNGYYYRCKVFPGCMGSNISLVFTKGRADWTSTFRLWQGTMDRYWCISRSANWKRICYYLYETKNGSADPFNNEWIVKNDGLHPPPTVSVRSSSYWGEKIILDSNNPW